MPVQTISGALTLDDFVLGAQNGGFTRVDEYDLSVEQANMPLTVDLVSGVPFAQYDPALELIDTRTNTVVSANNDLNNPSDLNSRINANTLIPGVPYKLRVFSFNATNILPSDYTLTVNTSQNFTVAQGLTNFADVQTGTNFNVVRALDGDDFTYDALGFDSLADEYQLTNLTLGQPVNFAVASLTTGFDSRVEVVNAGDGNIIQTSGDPAGNDSSVSFTPQTGIDYRLRVTSNNALSPNPAKQYNLNVNGGANAVTLRERSLPAAGITVGSISGNTSEDGETANFTVVLDTQPLANVTIPLSSSDTTEGTVAPNSLTFTPANWNVAQTVTVTGVDDALIDGNIAYDILTGAATSSDPSYNGIDPGDLSVTNVDNDVVPGGITVSPISGNTTEAGGTANFTVVLDNQPMADVTIPLSSSDTTEGTVAPNTLTFTSANWNVAQTVTVTGVDDSLTDGNVSYDILTGAASSGDSRYNGLDADNLTVTNIDNDLATDPLINPVYRFFNTVAGGHFFTTNEAERTFVENELPSFRFEGVGFKASTTPGENLVPIYRFFNTVAGGHFFTASEAERDFVIANFPALTIEGVGFYAYEADANRGSDIYRFFNTVAGGHFFTISESERDVVVNNLPQFNLEGVGFEAALP